MSATPSRLPRDAASQAHPAFAPTMPFELEATAQERAAAETQEAWHDTHPQPGDEFDTVPGALAALAHPPAAAPTVATVAATTTAANAPATTAAAAATAHTARAVDPSDPATGSFREALGGLQVRELVNEELFQRLFGPVG